MENLLIFAGMALVTYFTRSAMIFALGAGVPELFRRWLRYVPAAVLAALVAVAVLAIFTFLADHYAEHAGAAWQRQVCLYLNVLGHFSDFSKGMIDTKSVVFFLSGTAFFLFLATKVLESRRWR